MKELILHVGVPKAGSTTLQHYIFPYMNSIECPLNGRRQIKLRDMSRQFIRGNISAQSFAAFLRPYIESCNKDKIVLSDEGLYDSDHKLLRDVFLSEMSDLVSAVKILYLFRKQGDALASTYAEGGLLWLESSFEDLVESIFRENKVQATDQYLSTLRRRFIYLPTVDSLKSTFGSNKVHVLPMEALFDPDNMSVKSNLASFLEIEVDELENAFNNAITANKRSIDKEGEQVYSLGFKNNANVMGRLVKVVSNSRIYRYRLSNVLNHSWLNTLKNLIKPYLKRKSEFRITYERKKKLTAMFSDSNRSLATKYGLEGELSCYGYFPFLVEDTDNL